MRTWTTTTTVGADPVALLEVLTDPQACARWIGPPASPAVPRHAVSRMAREAVPC